MEKWKILTRDQAQSTAHKLRKFGSCNDIDDVTQEAALLKFECPKLTVNQIIAILVKRAKQDLPKSVVAFITIDGFDDKNCIEITDRIDELNAAITSSWRAATDATFKDLGWAVAADEDCRNNIMKNLKIGDRRARQKIAAAIKKLERGDEPGLFSGRGAA